MVGINVPIPVPVAYYSFGGWKASLFGDRHIYGPEGIDFYTRGKVVTVALAGSGHVEGRPRLPADALAHRGVVQCGHGPGSDPGPSASPVVPSERPAPPSRPGAVMPPSTHVHSIFWYVNANVTDPPCSVVLSDVRVRQLDRRDLVAVAQQADQHGREVLVADERVDEERRARSPLRRERDRLVLPLACRQARRRIPRRDDLVRDRRHVDRRLAERPCFWPVAITVAVVASGLAAEPAGPAGPSGRRGRHGPRRPGRPCAPAARRTDRVPAERRLVPRQLPETRRVASVLRG